MDHPDKPWEPYRKRHEDLTAQGNGDLGYGETAGGEAKAPGEARAEARNRRRSGGPSLSKSPHLEEYDRLLRAGWSSSSLERYARFRYGEQIAERTFRDRRKRLKVEVPKSAWDMVDPEKPVDVLRVRNELIQLQVARIAIDHGHERQMGKLFGSTRGEIQLLSDLLTSMKADLQDVGLMPKGPEKLEVSRPSPDEAPKHQTLGEVFGVDDGNVIELARFVHGLGKRTK